jgi:hypothetical protein
LKVERSRKTNGLDEISGNPLYSFKDEMLVVIECFFLDPLPFKRVTTNLRNLKNFLDESLV